MTSGCRVAIEAAAVPVVIETDAEYAVTHDMAPEVRLISSGDQGPPGPPGPSGGAAVQRLAGSELSALRAVYELDGYVYPLDCRDSVHIDLLLGVTLTAADPGQPVNVQRSGVLDDAGWSWTPGRVWLGIDGRITQTPPTDGFDVLIGAATSATRITLNLTETIELE